MRFSELVRLLEQNGFRLVKEKGSIRYYGKLNHPNLVRVDLWVEGGADRHLPRHPEGGWNLQEMIMLDLPYSLVIEATDDPEFFGYYSTDLEGFSGVGHSIEDCLYRARSGIREHVETMKQQGMSVPPSNPDPIVTIQNERRRKSA
jgi:predicted RNase H-like HicB family nuclease